MVRRCSDKLAKTLLFVFNALFLACGILMIGVGLYQTFNGDHKTVNKMIQDLDALSIGVIIIGVIVVIISFLGCCGALKESNCMITTFLIFLLIILIAEIVVAGLAFHYKGDIENFVEKNANKTFHNKNSNLWDTIQGDLKCCGVQGKTDWPNQNALPGSCCDPPLPKNDYCPSSKATGGCLPKLKDMVKSNYLVVGLVVLTVAFIEVMGIIFACCLRSAISERYQSV